MDTPRSPDDDMWWIGVKALSVTIDRCPTYEQLDHNLAILAHLSHNVLNLVGQLMSWCQDKCLGKGFRAIYNLNASYSEAAGLAGP